jgi:hypothetical protein
MSVDSSSEDKFAHHTEAAMSPVRAKEKQFSFHIFHLAKRFVIFKTLSPYLVNTRQIRCRICYLSQVY